MSIFCNNDDEFQDYIKEIDSSINGSQSTVTSKLQNNNNPDNLI